MKIGNDLYNVILYIGIKPRLIFSMSNLGWIEIIFFNTTIEQVGNQLSMGRTGYRDGSIPL